MRIGCLLILCVLLAGCTQPAAGPAPEPKPKPTAEANAVFTQLVDDYIGGYLDARPQTGTSLGLHQYDGKLGGFDKKSIDAELARLKSFDQQLTDLGIAHLNKQNAFDFRLLRGSIRREIFGIEEMRDFTRNPITYAGALDVNIYIKRNFAPLPDRVRSITAILNQAPKIFAAAHSNLDESLPRPLIETAIDTANGAADFLEKDLVDALKDVKDAQLMADFNAADKLAVRELRAYSDWLSNQKMLHANDQYALGRQSYIHLLEYGEMITMPPEQLLAIGMRELTNKQAVFAEAARAIDPTKKPAEVFEAIEKEHPTEQSLIPDVARDLDTIRQFVIDHHLVTVPSAVRATVAETPQYLRATSFASMDTPGPFETKATEAWYYVTPVESNWPAAQKEEWLDAFNFYTTDIVSIHEAYPGHYIQFLHLNASPATFPEKIFGSYAFIEGWAHYCEQMVVDEGFAGAPGGKVDTVRAAKFRLAQTDEALLRICRLCVSIKMHCAGMTVDEAAKFFQDNCYYGAKPAHDEAMRATFDPEYLYYTVGKLEILKLREDYHKQEGSGFSLQKFHDELLSHGMPPIRLLREVMLKDSAIWDQVL